MLKKSATAPKIEEQYGGPCDQHSQWTPNGYSAMMDHSSGRKHENSDYFYQSETCSFDMRRMQSLAEEVLGSIDPPFHNTGSLAQAQSKVRYHHITVFYVWDCTMGLKLVALIMTRLGLNY